MNNGNNNKKSQSPLEFLRETSLDSVNRVKSEARQEIPREMYRQIFGGAEKKFSGEIVPGEAIEMREVYSGKASETEKLRKQVSFERRLREEDRVLVERKTNELRVQIKAIHEEIIKVAQITPSLHQEVQKAAFQAPADPSTYEMFFLERLFEFIKSFRKKIENAHVWLESANKRAAKKNRWGANYKKYGAKYLLSGEHYLSRSAA